MIAALEPHAVLVALVWMLAANLFALGPDRVKVAALVAMLLTAGPILVAVIRSAGWTLGSLCAAVMLFQLRWTTHFIGRLWRSRG